MLTIRREDGRLNRLWRRCAAAVLAIALASWCAAAEKNILRVGTVADNPPLAFEQDGKLAGMEIDLARLLETQLGQVLHMQVLPAAGLLPALQRGDIDLVMAGLVAKSGDDGSNELMVSEVIPRNEVQVWFVAEHCRSAATGAGEIETCRIADGVRHR